VLTLLVFIQLLTPRHSFQKYVSEWDASGHVFTTFNRRRNQCTCMEHHLIQSFELSGFFGSFSNSFSSSSDQHTWSWRSSLVVSSSVCVVLTVLQHCICLIIWHHPPSQELGFCSLCPPPHHTLLTFEDTSQKWNAQYVCKKEQDAK
jgi:hypothetical protein